MTEKRDRGTASCMTLLAFLISLQSERADAAETMAEAALADDESTPILEQIVVSARKRDERLQDVPVSVAALSQETLANANVQRMDDVGKLVPNLNISTSQSQLPNATLRGVGSFGIVPGVGFYVNDVQQFEGQTVPFVDLERIEVLRGPQGTLYGGSNIGGAIKYITARPTPEFSGLFAVEGGNLGTRNYTGMVSGPILDDALRGRLTLTSEESDGFVYNTQLNRLTGGDKREAGRLTLESLLSDTTIRLYIDGSTQEGEDLIPLYRTPNDHTYSKNLAMDIAPVYERDVISGTLQVDHDFGNFALTSLSSAFYSERLGIGDSDFGPTPLQSVTLTQTQRNYSQELRLASTGESSLTWLVGVFAQYREVLDGSVFTVIPAAMTIPTKTRSEFNLYAAFANAVYTAGPWAFEGGARVEYNDNMARDVGLGIEADKSETELLPRVSATYHFDDETMAYAAITRGFTPGGVGNQRGLVVYNSETLTSYEVGAKGASPEGRIRYEAAAFYLDYQDRLFQSSERSTRGLIRVTRNIGSSHTYGVEFSATASLTREITLGAGIGLLESKWDKARFADPDSGNQNFDLHGFNAPFTPEYQGTLSLDWAHPLSSALVFGLRADASFVGQQYWNLTEVSKQRPYQTVNVGARLEADHWEIRISGSNIFDERYNLQYFTGPQFSLPYNFAQLGDPRTWLAHVAVKF